MFRIRQKLKIIKYSFSNHYEILGLEKDCSIEDIKKAFRNKVKQMHPDVK